MSSHFLSLRPSWLQRLRFRILSSLSTDRAREVDRCRQHLSLPSSCSPCAFRVMIWKLLLNPASVIFLRNSRTDEIVFHFFYFSSFYVSFLLSLNHLCSLTEIRQSTKDHFRSHRSHLFCSSFLSFLVLVSRVLSVHPSHPSQVEPDSSQSRCRHSTVGPICRAHQKKTRFDGQPAAERSRHPLPCLRVLLPSLLLVLIDSSLLPSLLPQGTSSVLLSSQSLCVPLPCAPLSFSSVSLTHVPSTPFSLFVSPPVSSFSISSSFRIVSFVRPHPTCHPIPTDHPNFAQNRLMRDFLTCLAHHLPFQIRAFPLNELSCGSFCVFLTFWWSEVWFHELMAIENVLCHHHFLYRSDLPHKLDSRPTLENSDCGPPEHCHHRQSRCIPLFSWVGPIPPLPAPFDQLQLLVELDGEESES
ncbi:hypothetical protein BLNAU_4114 [Blattamonas nauphoetae]|uniref:Uncharacterized protein n=1 Tax=Blattamonas nauphoetae TaxID=2049346 RepID=A0ABQ9YBC1_9EUKA|nr:hypothetical protein BLNAU_4114 [Blattamonas nauphoetae]